jgi:AcrR family transcriptional regulator
MAPRTNEQLIDLKEKRRKDIMDAALQVFASKGYTAATMAEVAKAAKVSKGNIYNYFTSKEELLKVIVERGFQMFFDFLERENVTEITDKIMAKYVWFSMESFVTDLEHWKVYFSLLMQSEVYIILEAEIWKMAIPFMQASQLYFEKKGAKNAYVEMRTFFSTLDGLGLNYVVDPENFPLKDATQMILDKFIYTNKEN